MDLGWRGRRKRVDRFKNGDTPSPRALQLFAPRTKTRRGRLRTTTPTPLCPPLGPPPFQPHSARAIREGAGVQRRMWFARPLFARPLFARPA